MNIVDLIIILVYIIALFAFGVFVGIRETAEDFLILSRKAKFPLVLFSVVSTWVGVGVIVGTSAGGYDSGISLAFTGAVGGLVAVGTIGFFAPIIKRFGDKFKAHTLGDFFLIRYSKSSQQLAGAIVVLSYMIATAVQFVGIAALLNVWAGLGFETAVILAALTTVIYTAFAGIKSDFYTDAIHFWVMTLVLFGILLPIILQASGGLTALQKLPPSYFEPFAFGGVAFFVGGLIFGTAGALVSMEFWQRIYASSSAKTARLAMMTSIVFIIFFYLLAGFLGMITKTIYPSLPHRDLALFTLMKNYLPVGFLGLGLAAFLAVFMSTVNTMIMVVSVTLTKDFYKGVVNPKASDKQLLKVGRGLTLLVGFIGFGLAMVIRDILALSLTSLFMLLVFVPAVVGGFFWKRATAKASFWSVLLGFIVGVVLLPKLSQTAFVPGFLVSLIVFITFSLKTTHSASENLSLSEN